MFTFNKLYVSFLFLFFSFVVTTSLLHHYQLVDAQSTTTAVNTGSYLSGNLNIGYTWVGTKITWSMDIAEASNTYAAVATSTSAMSSGLGIACLMPTASTSANCVGLSTSSYNVGSRSDASLVLNAAWVTGGRAYVTVTLDAANMGISAAGISASSFRVERGTPEPACRRSIRRLRTAVSPRSTSLALGQPRQHPQYSARHHHRHLHPS